ncbi:BglG family transcription antiterminator [Virgibacillus halodenitrificans]|uniref:BglG family transcription antiterminator n=1 Tax=Virgibacillus halodenitrificans TaxID=1482 RepID=UPI001F1C1C14|nr:BglG family transcription antiterminator [Virgibacillus halodenitrificans]
MLSSRMVLIIKELLAAESPQTGEALASTIQVTARTIRNDIRDINKVVQKKGGSIKSTRGIGYELEIVNDEAFKSFLQEVARSVNTSTNKTLETSEARINWIIRILLLEKKFIKLDDVADKLYISKSTLQNDLIEVRKILASYNLTLESKPYYGVKVQGKELHVRFCLSEYLFNRNSFTINMKNELNNILSKQEITSIQNIILEKVRENEIEISDIGLNNLIVHFAIACKRIRDRNYISLAPKDFEGIYSQIEYEVAKDIVTEIEVALDVEFPKTEIAYIGIHLLGTKKIAKTNINRQEFESFVKSELRDVIKEIISKIDHRLGLRLREDKELTIALGLHLKPAINRLQYGMNVRNPMVEEIKINYPLAFDAAILAGQILNERLGINIDEDEAGYIALHISAAMYRENVNRNVKRCIIVCASGVGSAMLLKYKLQSTYNQIEIVDTIDYYRLEETPLEEIDFIITTIPIDKDLPVPVIIINTILGTKDLSKIEGFLQNKNENKASFIHEELIFLQKDFQTREEVIKYLVNELEMANHVDHTFSESVLERERISPTSFGNLVAIPHPMEPQTTETFCTICTLKRPIDWGGNRVQFICLLSVGENKAPDLRHMYDILIEIIEDEQKIKRLLNCNEKKKFVALLNSIV